MKSKNPVLTAAAAAGLLTVLTSACFADLRLPAFTAYSAPNPESLRMSRRETGDARWGDPTQSVLWFGELKKTGGLSIRLALTLPADTSATLTLTAGDQVLTQTVKGTGAETVADVGKANVDKTGYWKFALRAPEGAVWAAPVTLHALLLDGPAAEGAHFNLEERRNAASVHLMYPVPKEEKITAFYNEATGVEDPEHTYYMACGFSGGYFGMQVNSAAERRIIFSVWDAAEGQDAKDRASVSEENHTTLLAKGDDVHASVFGNEGTGGHSHLKYMWKTGEAQKFVVTVKPDGTFTDYSGFWFHPEEGKWKLIAAFRAPKDGKHLGGLYSFSENFGGSTGHLCRKALFGNQWVRTEDGRWIELTEARFSHDGTGKTARLDRFMGVEDGRFFLSQGGFVEGFTKYGTSFTRPATGVAPNPELPQMPPAK